MVSVSQASDRMKIRSPFIFALQFITLVGYLIEISNSPSRVKYFGTFLCVIGSYTGVPCSIGWWVCIPSNDYNMTWSPVTVGWQTTSMESINVLSVWHCKYALEIWEGLSHPTSSVLKMNHDTYWDVSTWVVLFSPTDSILMHWQCYRCYCDRVLRCRTIGDHCNSVYLPPA